MGTRNSEILGFISLSSSVITILVRTSLWVEGRLPLLLKGTPTEHSVRKNWAAAWDMILLFSACTQNWSYATVPHIQILCGESWSPRNSITPVSSTSAQIPGPWESHTEISEPWNQGTAGDRILLDSVCTLEVVDYVPIISIQKFLLERTVLSGVLTHTQTHRGDKPQSETDQLTLEITREQDTRARS